jgi:hypothetical protein
MIFNGEAIGTQDQWLSRVHPPLVMAKKTSLLQTALVDDQLQQVNDARAMTTFCNI